MTLEGIDIRMPKIPWLPILMYHRVVERLDHPDPYRLCVETSEFERHMKYLVEGGYQTISVEDVVRAVSDDNWPWVKPAVITFDDGYMDNYTCAFPVLKRYGLSATIMLVSSYIGGTNVWDEGSPMGPALLLTPDQIREMGSHGVTYGSHTLTHPDMTELDEADAWRELVDSKAALQDLTGGEINTFCYPFGLSNPKLNEMAREAGYTAACGIEQTEHTEFNLSRVNSARTRNSTLIWKFKVSGMYFKMLGNPISRRLIDFARGGRYP